MFGCDTYEIDPDIMVLSKQLTSSYQPLSAILFSDPIYQGVATNSSVIGTFGHGFTTGGHPVAAAVALESLKIFAERGVVAHAAEMSHYFAEGLRQFADHSLVGEVRGVGLVGAIELVSDRTTKAPFEKPGSVGAHFISRSQLHGLIVRNLADVIALCPPLIIEERQIKELMSRLSKALDDTYAWSKRQKLASAG